MKTLQLQEMENLNAGQMSPGECAAGAIAIVAFGTAGLILSAGTAAPMVGLAATMLAINCG